MLVVFNKYLFSCNDKFYTINVVQISYNVEVSHEQGTNNTKFNKKIPSVTSDIVNPRATSHTRRAIKNTKLCPLDLSLIHI